MIFSFFLRVKKRISEIKNSECAVLYLGKYNEETGPPKSMHMLGCLLEKKYSVIFSSNISKASIEIYEANNSFNNKSNNFKNIERNFKFSAFVKRVYHFYLLMKFNFFINFSYFINPKINFVITQPFYFWLFFNPRIIYIRRANLSINETMHFSWPFNKFERRFLKKKQAIKLVYLVPQETPIINGILMVN